jgi:cytochrome oxidase Cu insertion factor (SCO1/SenC/PrrC family)
MAKEEINKTKSRITLLVIILVLCSPVFIATTYYLMGFRPGSMNYGDLLEVQELKGDGVSQIDSTIFRMKDLHGKWTMVTIDSGECNEACQSKLFYMRQVRVMQHTEKDRVGRLWLIDDNKTVSDELLEAYKGTLFINAKDSELVKAIETEEVHRNHIYLVDSMGNLMMRFPEELDPETMSKDIKRLLQVSQLEH